MQVIKPVDTCVTCQAQFKLLNELYGMCKALPEPGVNGVLQAAAEEYNQHHKEVHPVHPDAISPAKRQVIQDLLTKFEGLQVFGAVDADDKPLVQEGLIFVYKNRLIAMGPGGVEDLGRFIPALSNVTLEQHCMETWEECFGRKGE